MDASRPADAAELIAHLAWVRRLAHALVRDADRADDLAQDAVRVTLEQPADRVRGTQMKSWLRGVVRRLVVDRNRADASRHERERAVAPRESEPPTHEVVARLDQQQRVAQAVRALAEPYRSTILYRYLDQLSTREVAKRMEVSEELVRKRLLRGLAQLRERLDAEFGSDTKSWAVALLSLPGAAVVSVKAKVAVAAVVMVAAAITWRALEPFAVRARDESSQPGGRAAPAIADARRELPVSASSPTREPVAAKAMNPPTTTTSVRDQVVVHVAVVTHEGIACTEGRLIGFWYDANHVGSAGPSQRVDAVIAGATTDVVLPSTAFNFRLCASVDGLPPSRMTELVLGSARKEGDREGRTERTMTIEVGEHVASPMLTGEILVDGHSAVPRRLELQFEPDDPEPTIEHRIHALDARYEAGPLKRTFKRLMVRSDETIPASFPLKPDGRDATLDLALSTGRTLRLTVVDVKSGKPLPGIELYVSKSTASDPWEGDQYYVVTDANGRCDIRGLPLEGRFELRRDARLVVRGVPANADNPRRFQFPPDPLFALNLTKSMPEVIEQTVRIDAEGKPRHVFGQLRPEFLVVGSSGDEPAEIRFATRQGDLKWSRDIDKVPFDDHGRWSLDVVPDGEYRIWIERAQCRVSQIASVKIESDDVGPIELSPRPGSDVVLRVIHGPDEGLVRVLIPDPGALDGTFMTSAAMPIHGGTFEHRFRLEGRTTIYVWCGRDERELTASKRRHLEVDPATASIAELDLAGVAPRKLELTLSSGARPPDAKLHLMLVEEGGRVRPDVSEIADLVAGESRDPVTLEPGRYLYRLLTKDTATLVIGLGEVDAGGPDRPITLHCELESHKKSELGAGVEIYEVGDVQLGKPWCEVMRLRFAEAPALQDAETIFLPAGAKFTILEK